MAKIKFMQINIYKGKYLDDLVNFIRREDPHIIAMQEVTTGEINLYEDKTANLFELLKNQLGMSAVFHGDTSLGDSVVSSTFGNAVFSKFPIIESKVVALRRFRPISKTELADSKMWPILSRHILDAVLTVDGLKVHAMSLHGAWTAPPADTDETVRQAKIIAAYLESLGDEPFILGCDLNTVLDSQVVKIISETATNLMERLPYAYTTHPTMHKIAPRKLLVDYIFTSKHFKVESLRIPEVVISDHLPIVAELAMAI